MKTEDLIQLNRLLQEYKMKLSSSSSIKEIFKLQTELAEDIKKAVELERN